MRLTDAQKEDAALIVVIACKSVLCSPEFNPAYQSGWLSPDDTSTVYANTIKSIENKLHLACVESFTRRVARNEAVRHFRDELAKERGKRHLSFDDTSFVQGNVRRGPVSVNPAVSAQIRDEREFVRHLITRLPLRERTVVQIWMESGHGDGALKSAATCLRISPSRAHQLLESAKKRLRTWLTEGAIG